MEVLHDKLKKIMNDSSEKSHHSDRASKSKNAVGSGNMKPR